MKGWDNFKHSEITVTEKQFLKSCSSAAKTCTGLEQNEMCFVLPKQTDECYSVHTLRQIKINFIKPSAKQMATITRRNSLILGHVFIELLKKHYKLSVARAFFPVFLYPYRTIFTNLRPHVPTQQFCRSVTLHSTTVSISH